MKCHFFALIAGVLAKKVEFRNGDKLDILFLVQASSGLLEQRREIAASAEASINLIKEKHPFADVNVGLASFVDKPNVGVGIGKYGGWPAGYAEDYCYRLHAEMSEKSDFLHDAILKLPRQAGLDVNEGHVEALTVLTHDNNIKWRSDSNKVVVLFTNTLPHSGDYDPLQSYIDQYNSDIECIVDSRGTPYTMGGFGSMKQKPGLPGRIMWTPFEEQYLEYARLVNQQICHQDKSQDNLIAQYRQTVFAPERVQDAKPFDYEKQKTDPLYHCSHHEYPTWKETAQILKDADIKLVIGLVGLPHQTQPTHVPAGVRPDEASYKDVWTWIACDDELGMGSLDADLISFPAEDHTSFAPGFLDSLENENQLTCENEFAPITTTTDFPCAPPELQVVALMDASGSWATRGGEVSRKVSESLLTIKEVYPASQIGLASFVDKPNVGSGEGTYGGYHPAKGGDWCYKHILSLSENVTMEAIERQVTHQQWGWGMDAPEGQLEALLRLVADPAMGWTFDDRTERIVLLVTDDVAHAGSDYLPISSVVDDFNHAVECSGKTTIGGFGAIDHHLQDLGLWTSNQTDYYRLAELTKAQLCDGKELTDEEEREIDALHEEFKPYHVSDVKPFDLERLHTDPEGHCTENEYPDYKTVKNILESSGIKLILMVLDFDGEPSSLRSTISEQSRRLIPFDKLPSKLRKTFQARVKVDVTVSDVWNWVLHDPSALGDTASFMAPVTPMRMESFSAPLLTGLSSLVPVCAQV